MKKEIFTTVEALDSEIRKLNREWIIFKQLFSESNETVKILGNTASLFFSIIWNLLIESIFLTISRLTDPEKSFGKDHLTNLSLKRLITQIREDGSNKLLEELETNFFEITERSKPIRDWRNRKLSHADFKTKVSPDDYPMPTVTFMEVGQIIEKINTFMNDVRTEMGLDYMLYSEAIMSGGAKELVNFLKLGFIASENIFEINDLVFQLHKKLQKFQ